MVHLVINEYLHRVSCGCIQMLSLCVLIAAYLSVFWSFCRHGLRLMIIRSIGTSLSGLIRERGEAGGSQFVHWIESLDVRTQEVVFVFNPILNEVLEVLHLNLHNYFVYFVLRRFCGLRFGAFTLKSG